jgi:hypothetical protein
MAKTTTSTSKTKKPKIKRRGVHSKKKSSNKNSKSYKKSYRGQGK